MTLFLLWLLLVIFFKKNEYSIIITIFFNIY